MEENVSFERYSGVAIVLHWGMAFGFLLMFMSGLSMEYLDLDKSLKFNLYQWHKGGGVLLLLALVLRIGWRLYARPPALPAGFSDSEKALAKAGHGGLYVLMLLVPVSGWVLVSSSVYGLPTIVFGLFEWPHITGIQGNMAVFEGAEWAHFILTKLLGLLIVLHIGAVIKHVRSDKGNLVYRMWWRKN